MAQEQEKKVDGKAEDALEAVRKESQQKAQEIMQMLGLEAMTWQVCLSFFVPEAFLEICSP